jgi:hypothetical protein
LDKVEIRYNVPSRFSIEEGIDDRNYGTEASIALSAFAELYAGFADQVNDIYTVFDLIDGGYKELSVLQGNRNIVPIS